ncbi:hypothetical protein H4219_005434 [Mycoemilia scoparia]|uniref:Uncharacterized protein n=1 Tax=Mycoemilia scoparia TaxID=417184 RepID=A0A9W7ZXK9_9FUNG|nr:hypothetical protein H4219_005434 [Mycoemilia scoparia]
MVRLQSAYLMEYIPVLSVPPFVGIVFLVWHIWKRLKQQFRATDPSVDAADTTTATSITALMDPKYNGMIGKQYGTFDKHPSAATTTTAIIFDKSDKLKVINYFKGFITVTSALLQEFNCDEEVINRYTPKLMTIASGLLVCVDKNIDVCINCQVSKLYEGAKSTVNEVETYLAYHNDENRAYIEILFCLWQLNASANLLLICVMILHLQSSKQAVSAVATEVVVVAAAADYGGREIDIISYEFTILLNKIQILSIPVFKYICKHKTAGIAHFRWIKNSIEPQINRSHVRSFLDDSPFKNVLNSKAKSTDQQVGVAPVVGSSSSTGNRLSYQHQGHLKFTSSIEFANHVQKISNLSEHEDDVIDMESYPCPSDNEDEFEEAV